MIFFSSFTTIGLSQDRSLFIVDSLPHIDSLQKTLERYYTQQTIYEIEQFTYVEKWKWLKFAPSFGWNFTLNSPYIGWNSNALFNAINFKRKQRAYLTSIIHKSNLNYNKASIQLHLKNDLFGTKKQLYREKLKLLKLENDYMDIIIDQRVKHEITPSDFIIKQLAYQQKIIDLTRLKFELQQLRIEILQLAYYGNQLELFKTIDDVPTN